MPAARPPLPSALDAVDVILEAAATRRPILFLDFDGTLSPIVDRPDQAALAPGMAPVLANLAGRLELAIVSGRGLDDVRRRVGLDQVAVAGSHGFEIRDRSGRLVEQEAASEALPALDAAEHTLEDALGDVAGVIVERKRFAIAVHFRQAAADAVPRIEATVDAILSRHPMLEKSGGKMIFELRPRLDWHKGKAVVWLMDAVGEAAPFPIYIGDDLTDEDAFAAIRETGVGIRVGTPGEPTQARFVLDSPDAVREFLSRLLQRIESKESR